MGSARPDMAWEGLDTGCQDAYSIPVALYNTLYQDQSQVI